MSAPATSLEKLFDFESNFDAGLAAYFTANGMPANFVFFEAERTDLAVYVETSVGAATGHKATSDKTGTGIYEDDQFALNITITLTGERVLDPGKTGFASLLRYRVARARVLMLLGALRGGIDGITALSLGDLYSLMTVAFSSIDYEAGEGTGIDSARLTFAATFRILPGAWPVST